MVVSDHHGAVRVAENDLRSHVDELVHEEQPALEHLLMDEHTALALGGHHKHHAQKVRCKPRPRCIRKRHDGTVKERLDDIALLLRDKNIVPPLLQLYAKSAESLRNDAEILV